MEEEEKTDKTVKVEDVKSSCDFYRRYKDKPKLLIEEDPEKLSISPKISELITDLNRLITSYRVNTNFIGREILESLNIRYDVGKISKAIDKKTKELFKLIKNEINMDFSDVDEYNDWLFEIAFKDFWVEMTEIKRLKR